VVQEGFIKAYVNLNGFDTKKKFSSWIYRIVHNEAMNMLSKYKKQVLMKEGGLNMIAECDLEDDFIKNELVSRTHHCLEQMPIIYREPLSHSYIWKKNHMRRLVIYYEFPLVRWGHGLTEPKES
jgi:RNA polymerase sigma-70 factor (ECF subfamily)